MKLRLVFLLLLFIAGSLYAQYPRTSEQRQALEGIFKRFELQEPFIEQACTLWIQQGKERWDFDHRFEEMKDHLWPLFEQAGLITSSLPERLEYDAVLIHGALLRRIEQRWRYACELWEKGVRFKSIVFLSGKRPLQPSERAQVGDDPAVLSEADLTRWLYRTLPMPAGMEKIQVQFINAQPSGVNSRATTVDTVQSWLSTRPEARVCLAISNQPYVEYQHAVLDRLLPKDFILETVGPGIDSSPSVALMLDTLGRLLYQENLR